MGSSRYAVIHFLDAIAHSISEKRHSIERRGEQWWRCRSCDDWAPDLNGDGNVGECRCDPPNIQMTMVLNVQKTQETGFPAFETAPQMVIRNTRQDYWCHRWKPRGLRAAWAWLMTPRRERKRGA